MSATKPFKILVGCKRVIDYAVKVRAKADKTGVETANVKHSMNPFDEIAVEEALRMKERLGPETIKEVVALSIGPKQCQETLKTALAMGADRAIHVEVDEKAGYGPTEIAKIMKKVVEKEDPKIVFLGKQAIDDDCGQTGPMLAGLLNWSQATFASKVEMQDHKLKVACEVDNGIEEILCPLPTVVTTDLRLNEPRYATLQNIMKAKTKPLIKETVDGLGLMDDLKPLIKVVSVDEPAKRAGGVIVESVDELLTKLRERGINI
jgi:electron transfer flavoprotein beta subunit